MTFIEACREAQKKAKRVKLGAVKIKRRELSAIVYDDGTVEFSFCPNVSELVMNDWEIVK